MTRILILTPVLNGATFLDAAIDSVRKQNHTNWRQIVLDAGSTDGSQDLVKIHAASDPRVILHEEKDQGMYDAICRGFDREARGFDVLAWLNADDLYTPWAFSEVEREFGKGALWITGLPGIWDTEGRLRGVLPRGRVLRKDILAGHHHDGFLGAIQQESVFFSAELFNNLSFAERRIFTSQRLAGDFFLWKCFAQRCELLTIPSVLGGFRIHSANRSRVFASAYQKEIVETGAMSPKCSLFLKVMRHIRNIRAATEAIKAFEKASLELILEVGGEGENEKLD